MTEKTEVQMNYDSVRSFFPSDLPRFFGLEEREMDFFGINFSENRVHGESRIVSRNYYLTALINRQTTDKYSNISFQPSENKWISLEDNIFREVRNDKRFSSSHLEMKYPLLALWVVNSGQPVETPFRFAELIRYADHEQFRKKGIASAVLSQVCERMKTEGTEFVYVNYNWIKWPKKSEVVPVGVPGSIRKEIVSCFPPKYLDYDRKFIGLGSNGFFIFTDRERNHAEHKRAMERHREHGKRIDEYLAELREKDCSLAR
jgi:hypothetical protein